MIRAKLALSAPAAIIAAALVWSGCGKGESSQYKLIILHTNDLHSYLMGHDPEADYSPLTVNDDSTIGGMARLAAQVANERAAAGNVREQRQATPPDCRCCGRCPRR